MRVLGQAQMTVKIGKQKIKHSVVVAECINARILGLDLLGYHDGNINLRAKILRLKGVEIPLIWKRGTGCARIAVAETVTVRAGHRTIVETKSERVLATGDWLVEPLPKALAQDNLAVAKTLANGGSDTVLVEVMNPTDQDVLLYKGTNVATTEKVELLPGF